VVIGGYSASSGYWRIQC